MMNGCRKSDSAIVAERPTNKAGQLAAEPVERRAGTEGNAGQQSTRRAQDRESVSQALARIRRVASQRKKEKFTALLHHISLEHLNEAFFELKENAAPGVDGLRWRAYEEDLDSNIADLHSRLHKGAYRALPPARLHTEAGRSTAPTRGCRPRRQTRPTGDYRSSERDLRGRLPRVLVRIPTEARTA